LIHSLGSGQMAHPAIVEAEFNRIMICRELRANIEAMRDAGATVQYFAVDVRDENALKALIRTARQRYGRIDGVIHGAGVKQDRLAIDKDVESFRDVIDTKVASALVLSRELDPKSLKFLLFFSSVSGCTGNRGQIDYAAANAILNHLALDLDHSWTATRVLSVCWGPWADKGMISPALRRQLEERGVQAIPPSAGVQALDWELCHWRKGEGCILLGDGPWRTGDLQ
jgi:NAD(P)-dependent dehydrogenase (short-subunit alcohol dehydrogenase family)